MIDPDPDPAIPYFDYFNTHFDFLVLSIFWLKGHRFAQQKFDVGDVAKIQHLVVDYHLFGVWQGRNEMESVLGQFKQPKELWVCSDPRLYYAKGRLTGILELHEDRPMITVTNTTEVHGKWMDWLFPGNTNVRLLRNFW